MNGDLGTVRDEGALGVAAAAPRPLRREPRRRLNGGWVLMVVAGLVAAVANYALVRPAEAGVEVVVLAADAPPGTRASALEVSTVALDLDDPSAHRLVLPDQLAGELADLVTSRRLVAGGMLRLDDLQPAGGDGSTGAMSVPIAAARAVGGAIAPGDRVDVIAGDEGQVAYVVTGLEVLDVLRPDAVGGLGGGMSGEVAITLGVDADQALAIAEALRSGEVDIVRTAAGAG